MGLDGSTRLRCNKCWQVMSSGFAWVTICSHVFCEDDASRWFSRQSSCPCCSTPLKRDASDLKKVRVDADESRPMALWGENPTVIFDACAGALGFYVYQKKQELAWMNHVMGQKEKQAQATVVEAQKAVRDRDEHIHTLNQKLAVCAEEMQRKDAAYLELKQSHKEKTRMCKNYEKLYNQMQNMNSKARKSPLGSSVSPHARPRLAGEAEAPQPRSTFDNNIAVRRSEAVRHSVSSFGLDASPKHRALPSTGCSASTPSKATFLSTLGRPRHHTHDYPSSLLNSKRKASPSLKHSMSFTPRPTETPRPSLNPLLFSSRASMQRESLRPRTPSRTPLTPATVTTGTLYKGPTRPSLLLGRTGGTVR
ncbi:RING-type domain-containing protein [Plasmodiophora brassicae]